MSKKECPWKDMTPRDTVCLALSLVVGIGGSCLVDVIMPPARAEAPATVQVQVVDRPTLEDGAAELWSIDSKWPEPEPDYSYIPLDKPLAEALASCCEECGVPLELALGVIEVESNFDVTAVNPVSGCYGLMQLNPQYFPGELSPSENIQAGMSYLGELLERYNGDQGAALTAYNAGHDTGSRTYANAVLAAAERLEELTAQPSNEALTLDELREMDGEPVWVRNLCTGDYTCRVIASTDKHFTFFTDGGAKENRSYGSYWLAYRRKPEEGTA